MTTTTICKQFVSIVLIIACILTTASFLPNKTFAEETESGVQTKIDELKSVYSDGTYFTSSGEACYSCASSGCCLGNIPSRTSADGSVVLPSGASVQAVCGYAYSCCSFATYAFYYIFGYHFKNCSTVPLSEAKIGDCVLMYSGYGPHYGIYMGQDSEYIYLYNSNGTAPLNNKVLTYQGFRKSSWCISTIYRAPNYDAVDNAFKDKIAPVVEGAYISNVTSQGYEVNFTVSEETEIGGASIVTYLESNPDAKIETKAACVSFSEDGIYTFKGYVNSSELDFADGDYVTQVYATDAASNKSEVDVSSATVPSYIAKVEITNISSKGYTVTCVLNETSGVSKVQFPTWSEAGGKEKLSNDWQKNEKYTGTITGNVITYRVNFENFNNEIGIYNTHIYVFDESGNVMANDAVSTDVTDLFLKLI